MTLLKRLLSFSLILILLTGPAAMAVSEYDTPEEPAGPSFNTSYLEAMLNAARDGSTEALEAGATAEAAWNAQIISEELTATATAFFYNEEQSTNARIVAIADYLVGLGITELAGEPVQFRIVASSKNIRSGPAREYERLGSFANGTIVTFISSNGNGWLEVTDGELSGWCSAIHLAPFDGTPAPIWIEGPSSNPANNNAIATEVTPPIDHTQNDLFWLALAIQLEAGSEWLCDEHQLLVGQVVLNRVAPPAFPPTTIYGVVHQPGQYPWAGHSWSQIPISERAFANAQRLLNGERFVPANVVFQAQFPQGDGTYRILTCEVSGNQHWFGYLN